MACYYPMKMYRSPSGPNPNGKWPLVSHSKDPNSASMDIPCGRCIGCRLERSRQWAIRCVNEAQMHEQNCFITLTYDNDNIIFGKNETGTLVPNDLQLFWKRLRKEINKNGNHKCRYFACGEYGGTTNRPHYHACVFGYDFPDKIYHTTKEGNSLYSSAMLNNIWGNGHCLIGSVTFESAAYVARYIMGKKLGREKDYYVEQGIEPEFVRMSRRPGIGTKWFEKYHKDVTTFDIQVINNKETRPPKFYDKILEKTNPELYNKNKTNRKTYKFKTRLQITQNTKNILWYSKRKKNENQIKEKIKLQKIERLKRDLE